MVNREKIIKIIDNTKINKKINFKKLEHNYLKQVYFDSWEHITNKNVKLITYYWIAQTHALRTVFPMKNTTSNYVKFFKTLKGAKTNFIKEYIKEIN